MLYRALINLSKGNRIIQQGEVFSHSILSKEALEVLTQRGRVAPVASPPLEALPGWSGRAKKLAKAGIATIDQLVEAEAGAVEAALKISTDVADKLRAEALELLKAPAPHG